MLLPCPAARTIHRQKLLTRAELAHRAAVARHGLRTPPAGALRCLELQIRAMLQERRYLRSLQPPS